MTATINECLAELKSVLDAALVDTYAQKVRDYRTFPDKLNVEVVLSYQGWNPAGSTSGGQFGSYDITAVIAAQIADEGDPETALRNAEQLLNALENELIDTLSKDGPGYKTDYWLKVYWPQSSTRPPSPPEKPKMRWANVPFRLILG